jgi:hypothetical protein
MVLVPVRHTVNLVREMSVLPQGVVNAPTNA